MVQAIIVMGGLGVLFGVFLTYFHIKFRVEENPLIKSLHLLLPNANCGACGYPGCSAFAEALLEKKVSPEKCSGISSENLSKICRILGIEEKTKVKMVARVFCSGGNNATRKFEYNTLKDCRSLNILFDTNLNCTYGCIGFGSCEKKCPFGAIKMMNNLPEIDEEKCTGCGICVEVCPKKIIRLVPYNKKVYIRCCSHDKGSVVIKICKTGCIGCGKCVKVCPRNAISLQENLAIIDYEKCDNCGKCIEECPRKVIFSIPLKKLSLA